MPDLRLVIFDVDGTLVDSQTEIVASLTSAFAAEGLAVPDRPTLLSIVGLSLDEAFTVLCPDSDAAQRARMVQGYKDSYMGLRDRARQFGPLFPGAMAALQHFAGQDETLLAVATGKSRRGLDKLLDHHGLTGFFHSEQVSDHHPSKPHPSMILTALDETGVSPQSAVMVGDTTFDMDMARAAGIRAVGVGWGYHPVADLRADLVINDFAALAGAVDQLLGPSK